MRFPGEDGSVSSLRVRSSSVMCSTMCEYMLHIYLFVS